MTPPASININTATYGEIMSFVFKRMMAQPNYTPYEFADSAGTSRCVIGHFMTDAMLADPRHSEMFISDVFLALKVDDFNRQQFLRFLQTKYDSLLRDKAAPPEIWKPALRQRFDEIAAALGITYDNGTPE